jgi:type IV pilus assembly protein PilY1
MNPNKIKQWIALVLAMSASNISAEDIDLFMGIDPTDSDNRPNVLIVLDNSTNWARQSQQWPDGGTQGVSELETLRDVVGSFSDDINVGLMMFARNGNAREGQVRFHVRSMDAPNRKRFQDIMNFMIPNATSTSDSDVVPQSTNYDLLMNSAFRYFNGLDRYEYIDAQGGDRKDFKGNTGSGVFNPSPAPAGYSWAYDSKTQRKYNRPPSGAGSCGTKNYIIFIGNGYPNQAGTKQELKNAAALVGLTDPNIANDVAGGDNGRVSDEWTRMMRNYGVKNALGEWEGITTYTIDVCNAACEAAQEKLLRSMARQGGGKYYKSTSKEELSAAIQQTFAEIQSVNSVFASASLPVSVNTQGTYLNQVFIGMFRPDAKAAPRWKGNLKQYKFLLSEQGDSYGLGLVGADDRTAINKETGFIALCARSFWTKPDADPVPYWAYPGSEAEGQCSPESAWQDTPDGNIVEKGAAGYKLRAITPSARSVKTCTGCGDNSTLADFNTGNTSITDVALGAANATERNNIINWTRGTDTFDEDGDLNVTEMRPSALGDVVHSRPVAVDYGGSTGVVVFYGANDGMLHAIDGNQTGTGAGGELWSFVAPEQYGRLKRIYDNDLAITFPSVGDATAKPYFFDGPVTATKDGSTVRIFATQRRGGRMVYAFNVNNPAAPTLLWRRGCTTPLGNDAGCMTGFDGIGQTWSAPKPLKAEGYASGAAKLPMLIMGGGYDTCEDAEPNTCISPKGNKVYVLDEAGGTLLKTFTTDRSVVGDVTVVPNNTTGLADLAYLTDSGGNIYRIDIGTAAPSAWTITKIAALGCDTPSCPAGEANRKFLFAPEVVVMTQYPGQYAVLVGSGDREHPLKSNSVAMGVQNAFFMVMDKPTESSWLSEEATRLTAMSQPLICLKSLAKISNTGSDPDPTTLDEAKGWYLTLSATEQVVTSAVVLFGEATFSTHMPASPAPGACSSDLGIARVYNVSYLNAAAVGSSDKRFEQIQGGGLPPSPVSGLVTVENPTTGQPMTVPFIIGASKDSPVEVTLKSGSSGVAGNKERVYWYIEQ